MNKVLESFGDTIRELQTDPSNGSAKPGEVELAVKLFDTFSKPKPVKIEEPFEQEDDIKPLKEEPPMKRFKKDVKKAFLVTLLFFGMQLPQVANLIAKISEKTTVRTAITLLVFFILVLFIMKLIG